MAKAPTGKTFNGSSGNDSISGTAYGDTIYGNGGNDTITGNGGADTITGGAGADVFRYLSYADSRAAGGIDTITDFNNAQDRLDLTAFGGATLESAWQAGAGRQATLSFNGSRTTLSIFDGSSAPVFQIYLTGDHRTLAGIQGISYPPPTIVISDASVDEAAGTVTFTVTRSGSGVAGSASSVAFATADGTATAGADYTAASGVLNFAAGETVKTITVAIANDKLMESAEGFLLSLTAVTNAIVADPIGMATILDNDRPTESWDDLIGTAGDDNVDLLGGDDRFSGGGGNDWIDGGDGDDDISGGDGDDIIIGGSGSNGLYGDNGRDRFIIGQETPLTRNGIYGGADIDTVDASQANYAMHFEWQPEWPYQQVTISHLPTGYILGAANEVEHWMGGSAGDVFGFAGMGFGLTIEGNGGNDVITGGDGDDVLLGGDGDDVVVVGRGNDSVDGGHGFDSVELGGMAAGAWVNGFEDGGFEVNEGWTRVASVSGVERLVGSAFADELNFTFTTVAVTLDGGGGDDYVVGGTEVDRLNGGEGNDVLDGGVGADLIFGDGGDDRLVIANVGDGATDTLNGGSGHDVIDGRDSWRALYFDSGFSGSVITILEKENWTTVAVAEEVEAIIGSAYDDQIYVHSMTGPMILDGAGGDDIIVAGQGNDLLYGGAGDDWLRGWGSTDVLDGGDGHDTVGLSFGHSQGGVDFTFQENSSGTPWIVTSWEGTHTVINVEAVGFGGSSFADRATGGAGDDQFEGGDGDDRFVGGAGDDRLFGDDGADVLHGGLGADMLEGGWDGYEDLYIYNSLAESNATFGIDTVSHYGTTQDRIDLSQIDIDASTPEVETADWIFVGEEHRADVDAAQATLHYDSAREGTVLRLFLNDGDSEADFELLIVGDPADQTMLIGVTDLV